MKRDKLKKLCELLNKYCEGNTRCFVDYDLELNCFDTLLDGKSESIGAESVICLKFGFIDWLFKKGLIDMSKCMETDDFRILMQHYEARDCALMVLATRWDPCILLVDWLEEGKEKG